MTERCELRGGGESCATCEAHKPSPMFASGHKARIYENYQDARLPAPGENEWSLEAGELLDVPADTPVLGWRFWAVGAGRDGVRLLAPYRPDPDFPSAVWQPGTNEVSTAKCWADPCQVEAHPSPNCWCGLRAMTTKDALAAFADDQGKRIPATTAVAEVEMWGRVVGPAPGDDWKRTLRSQYARITGPLYVFNCPDGWAEELAGHYGVELGA